MVVARNRASQRETTGIQDSRDCCLCKALSRWSHQFRSVICALLKGSRVVKIGPRASSPTVLSTRSEAGSKLWADPQLPAVSPQEKTQTTEGARSAYRRRKQRSHHRGSCSNGGGYSPQLAQSFASSQPLAFPHPLAFARSAAGRTRSAGRERRKPHTTNGPVPKRPPHLKAELPAGAVAGQNASYYVQYWWERAEVCVVGGGGPHGPPRQVGTRPSLPSSWKLPPLAMAGVVVLTRKARVCGGESVS